MIDEFNGDSLDPAWTFVDPVGDCTCVVENGCAVITLPDTASHDSLPSDTAPKLLRDVPAGDDWQVVASFRSQVGPGNYVTQAFGIVVTNASNATLIRFDCYSAASESARIYVRSIGGTHLNAGAPHEDIGSSPAHLRLTKTGTSWTAAISQNGIDWTDMVTFAMATAPAKVGVHAMNSGSPRPGFVLRLDRFTDDGSMPAEPGDIAGTLVYAETFPGAATDPWPVDWTDGSSNGGTAVQGGGSVGELSHIGANLSTGRVSLESVSMLNVRIQGKLRWTNNAGTVAYLAIGLRCTGGWADEFAADTCYAIELNHKNGFVRLLRVCRGSEIVDPTKYGQYSLLQKTEDIVYSPLDTNWQGFKLECIGPWVRFKMWPDSGAEPGAWTVKAIDYVNDVAGSVALAFAANRTGIVNANTVELADIEVYDVSVSNGGGQGMTTAIPEAPTGVKVIAIGDHFAVSWFDPDANRSREENDDGDIDPGTDEQSVTEYFVVETSADGLTWSDLDTVKWPTMQYEATAHTSGTRHYRVRAGNAYGESDPSESDSATARSAPTAGAVTLTEVVGGVLVEWSTVTDAETIGIQTSPDDSDWEDVVADLPGSTTSSLLGGLSAETLYYVRIVATNAIGSSNGASSVIETGPAAPDAPASLTATAHVSDISLVWDAVTGEDGFEVQRSTDAVTWSSYATLDANDPALDGITGDDGQAYYFRIRATLAGTVGSAWTYSNRVVFPWVTTDAPDRPNAPFDLVVSISGQTASLSWAICSGNELGCHVYQSVATPGNYQRVRSVGRGVTDVTLPNLAAGTRYYWVVSAYNDQGESNPSNVVTAVTDSLSAPTAPSGLTVTGRFQFALEFSWTDNSSNETSFDLRVRDAVGGEQTVVLPAGSTSGTVAGLQPGTSHEARVRAVGDGGPSDWSNSVVTSTLPLARAPGTPTGQEFTNPQETSLVFEWIDPDSLADQFHIAVRERDTEILRIRVTPDGGSPVEQLVPLDNDSTTGGEVAVITWTDLSGGTDSHTIERLVDSTWEEIATVAAGITRYEYTRRTDTNGELNFFVAPNGMAQQQLHVGNLQPGNEYMGRVRGINEVGISEWSEYAHGQTRESSPRVPNAPGDLRVTEFGGIVARVSFIDMSDNESGFRIERKTGAGAYSTLVTLGPQVGVGTTITHDDTTVAANTTYTYRVYAFAGTRDSASSGEAEITMSNPGTVPAAPSDTRLTLVGAQSVLVQWEDNSDDETGFEVHRSTTSGSGHAPVGTVGPNVTSFIDPGLTASTTYYYIVRAINGFGNSAFDDEVAITTETGTPTEPDPPTGLAGYATSPSTALLTWNAASGEVEAIQIKRGPTSDIGGHTLVEEVGRHRTNYVDVGLTPNTTYYYSLAFIYSDGNEVAGAEAVPVTTPTIGGGTGKQPHGRGARKRFVRTFEKDESETTIFVAETPHRITVFFATTDDSSNGPFCAMKIAGVQVASFGPGAGQMSTSGQIIKKGEAVTITFSGTGTGQGTFLLNTEPV